MTKRTGKKNTAPRSASESSASAKVTTATATISPPRPHPWLFALSAAVFVIWLGFLAYVAWRVVQ